MKFFPAEASGGRAYLSAVAGPCPGLRFCPTGGITMARRRRLPRAAQRRLRRRVLAHAQGRRGRRGLGAHRAAGPRRPRPCAADRADRGGHGTARGLPGRESAKSAMDESHGSRAAVDCCGLRFTLAVRSGARGRQWIGWLARSHLTRPLGIH